MSRKKYGREPHSASSRKKSKHRKATRTNEFLLKVYNKLISVIEHSTVTWDGIKLEILESQLGIAWRLLSKLIRKGYVYAYTLESTVGFPNYGIQYYAVARAPFPELEEII